MNQNVFKKYSNRSNAMRAIKKAGLLVGTYRIDSVDGSKAVSVVEVTVPAAKPDKTMEQQQIRDYVERTSRATPPNRKREREQAVEALRGGSFADRPVTSKKERAVVAANKALAAGATGVRDAATAAPQRSEKELARLETARKAGLKFPEAFIEGGCPHCGDVRNGCTPNGKEGTRAGDNELYCHVCNTAFNATTGKRVAQRKGKNGVRGSVKGKVMPKGYHIEKVRETKNNVTRYSDGTVGAKIWDVLDMLPGGPKVVTVAQAAEACGKAGINATSATLGFYRWRRFHGQRGRVNLKKAQK